MSIKCNIQDIHQAALYTSVKNRLIALQHPSILGVSIQEEVKNRNFVHIIKAIKEQAVCNRDAVERVVGEKLLLDILKVQV